MPRQQRSITRKSLRHGTRQHSYYLGSQQEPIRNDVFSLSLEPSVMNLTNHFGRRRRHSRRRRNSRSRSRRNYRSRSARENDVDEFVQTQDQEEIEGRRLPSQPNNEDNRKPSTSLRTSSRETEQRPSSRKSQPNNEDYRKPSTSLRMSSREAEQRPSSGNRRLKSNESLEAVTTLHKNSNFNRNNPSCCNLSQKSSNVELSSDKKEYSTTNKHSEAAITKLKPQISGKSEKIDKKNNSLLETTTKEDKKTPSKTTTTKDDKNSAVAEMKASKTDSNVGTSAKSIASNKPMNNIHHNLDARKTDMALRLPTPEASTSHFGKSKTPEPKHEELPPPLCDKSEL